MPVALQDSQRDASGRLSNNLDEDEIKAKFAIASTFVKETATYIENRGKEVGRAKKRLIPKKKKQQMNVITRWLPS